MAGEIMLKIAVLSDELNSNILKEHIIRYSIYYNNDYEVTIFSKSDELLGVVCSVNIYDIIFIDVDINENVIETIHHIRKHHLDEDIAIVLLSSSLMCSVELLKIRPFNFISYPMKYEDVSRCIDEYYRFKRKNNRLFKYIRNKSSSDIEVSKIIFFQSSGRKVIIHTLSEQLEFYGKLSDCKKQPCCWNFIEIHQSYLVNPMHIKQRERNSMTVSGDVKLPISRRRIPIIKEKFIW